MLTVRDGWRAPLLHFLVLGGILFAIERALPQGFSFGRETIAVADADLQQIRDQWIRSTGRPPTPPQLEANLRSWLGDEAMFREALRRGLDADDSVVRQRLLRNLRFADPERSDEPEELLAAARSLGMVRQDLVIRRRLIQRMEQTLTDDLRVSDADLRAYLEAHPQRYSEPARYAFDHVFIAGQSAEAKSRAVVLLAQLQSGVENGAKQGDSFALPVGKSAQSADELSRRIGPALAAGVVGAQVMVWSGPFESTYGLHLVRVTKVVPAAAPDLSQLRFAAVRALHAERREQQLQIERARLLSRYKVEYPPGVVLEASP